LTVQETRFSPHTPDSYSMPVALAVTISGRWLTREFDVGSSKL
jgi:hypothetical protein